MEPTTFLLLTSIPMLIAGVALVMKNKRDAKAEVANEARKRAKQRIAERAFSDTVPDNDPYRSGVEYAVTSDFSAFDDSFNAHGVPLDDEQVNTIGRIFEGYGANIKHRAKNGIGANVLVASGVPMNLTAIDKNNIVKPGEVEYLDPEYEWPEAHTRG